MCNIKAIPFFIKSGVFSPHVNVEMIQTKKDIYVRGKKFRIAKDHLMYPDEYLIRDATVTWYCCAECGHISKEYEKEIIQNEKQDY